MLQIATGKLFHGPTLKVNHLRGTLFSNLARLPAKGISTLAGKLGSADTLLQRTPSLIYEVDESIEGEKLAPGILAGYGIDRYQLDFSALVSLFLRVTCNPDQALVARLTSGAPGLAVDAAPNHLLKRVFDRSVDPSAEEIDAFARFVEALLGLERTTYLAVMQAIRTLVTGLHRMGDDLAISYTLMVAALEALAMKFDGHETRWEDVEERKRASVEAALSSADSKVAAAVRGAIAAHEHVLLRRRFKAFILAALPDSFFGDEASTSVAPPGRLDLGDALDVAYEVRSKYVHALERLPAELTHRRGFAEKIVLMDRRAALSFQGLFRVARATIIEFVQRQPKVDKQPHDYIYETGSVQRVLLDPSAWMGPDAVHKEGGRDWFEGFLELFDRNVLGEVQPKMIGLRPSLDKIEELHKLSKVSSESRRGYVALLNAVHFLLPAQFQPGNPAALLKRWGNDIRVQCPEALLLFCLSGTVPPWPIEQQAEVLREHLVRRGKKSGLRFPQRLDTAMTLELVERYRTAGQWEQALEWLTRACEEFPEFPQVRELRRAAEPEGVISWRRVLVPQSEGT